MALDRLHLDLKSKLDFKFKHLRKSFRVIVFDSNDPGLQLMEEERGLDAFLSHAKPPQLCPDTLVLCDS